MELPCPVSFLCAPSFRAALLLAPHILLGGVAILRSWPSLNVRPFSLRRRIFAGVATEGVNSVGYFI